MTGNGADVWIRALLQGDGERPGLALRDQLALLARDLEVVLDRSLVDELERDRAVRNGLLGEGELELLHLHGDGGCRRRARPRPNGCGCDERRERDPERKRQTIHEAP